MHLDQVFFFEFRSSITSVESLGKLKDKEIHEQLFQWYRYEFSFGERRAILKAYGLVLEESLIRNVRFPFGILVSLFYVIPEMYFGK